MKLKFILTASALLFLSACASYRPMIPIEIGKEPAINGSDFYVVENPEKIILQFEDSNLHQASGGGLLFALIEAGVEANRAAKAERLGMPIKQALVDFNLSQHSRDRIEKSIYQVDWLKAEKVFITPEEEIDAQVKKNEKTIVKLKISPILTPDFSTLRFKTLLEVHSNVAKKKVGDPIYRLTLDDVIEIVESNQGMEMNAELWSKDNGVKVKNAIMKGIDQAVQKINEALNDPTRAF